MQASVFSAEAIAIPAPLPANATQGLHDYAVPNGANNKNAALAFDRWFQSQPEQYACGNARGIPVRTDVLASDLATDPVRE